MKSSFCISIVSHGQGELVKKLLKSLISKNFISLDYEIMITFNKEEPTNFLKEFENLNIKVIKNKKEKGFAENHNFAFMESSKSYFIISNPDIEIQDFGNLFDESLDISEFITCPLIFDKKGELEDNFRDFPTPFSLTLRKLGFKVNQSSSTKFDWAAGMFLIFPKNLYELLGGFDDKYFMYFEDVDLFYRSKQMGINYLCNHTIKVIHDARRSSRKEIFYFLIHLKSAVRFFLKIKKII